MSYVYLYTIIRYAKYAIMVSKCMSWCVERCVNLVYLTLLLQWN